MKYKIGEEQGSAIRLCHEKGIETIRGLGIGQKSQRVHYFYNRGNCDYEQDVVADADGFFSQDGIFLVNCALKDDEIAFFHLSILLSKCKSQDEVDEMLCNHLEGTDRHSRGLIKGMQAFNLEIDRLASC